MNSNNSPNSPLAVAFEGFSTLLISSISQQISSYLRSSRQIEISIEELAGVIREPLNRMTGSVKPENSGQALATVPYHLRGTGMMVAPMIKNKATRGRKKQTTDIPGINCIYVFKRNTRQGEVCNQSVESHEDGLPYCNNCRKKAAVKQEIASHLRKRDGIESPEKGSAIKIREDDIPSDTEEGPNLVVSEYPAREGYFIEEEHKFIVQPLPDRRVVALKVLNSDGSERDLTEEDIKLAHSLKLSTLNRGAKR